MGFDWDKDSFSSSVIFKIRIMYALYLPMLKQYFAGSEARSREAF